VLVKNIDVARTEIYRALEELQKRGLVEREISRPYKFKATPLKSGLKILMLQRLQQYEEMQKKAEVIFQKIREQKHCFLRSTCFSRLTPISHQHNNIEFYSAKNSRELQFQAGVPRRRYVLLGL